MHFSIFVTLLCVMLHSAVADSAASESIKQTINLFPMCVDGHNFSGLRNVFAPNATANLHPPGGGIYYGVDEIIEAVSGLQNVSSQHGFTTQHVEMLSETSANATTYLFANFYGKGSQIGQIYTVYGIYTTSLSMYAPGWRITYMALDLLHSTGNSSIAFPDGYPA